MSCTPLTMVSKKQHDSSRYHVLPFYHTFRFSLQFFTSSPLQSAWSFATSEAPSSWHRVHLHQDQKCNLNMPVQCLCHLCLRNRRKKSTRVSAENVCYLDHVQQQLAMGKLQYSFSLEESLFWSSIQIPTFWAISEPSTCKWFSKMSKKCPNQRQLKKGSFKGVIHYQVASNDPRENGKMRRKKRLC